ncbi:MAG: Gfo/Idh/MocA family oxidoreductase [Phycisphaerae bacterium]|jgi:predicted dehydrogenase
MPAPYRVGIIGRTGKGDYGHGLDVVWNGVENAKVVAVADADEKGRADAARRVNAPKAYADYREMLEKERPQIVSIAPRWLDCHRDMVLACAEFGCHMLIEKPLTRTLAEADEMIAACEAKHLKMAIAHQARHSPRMPHLLELLASEKLGRLLELRGRGKEDHRGGGEDLMVLGTHIMDLMRLLAGDPSWCSARVFEKGKPVSRAEVREGNEGIGPLAGDEIIATYGFKNPTAGFFGTQRSRFGAGARWGLSLYAEKGMVTIGGAKAPGFPSIFFTDDPSWAPGASKAQWIEITSAGPGLPETAKEVHAQNPANILMAKDLIRAIDTDTQPRGSMYDGRAALEMILAVYESHRLNAPVPLPLKNREHPLTLL